MKQVPCVSIVVCTDGRASSLADTLAGLRQLDYPEFEVCVVYGPTADGTRELLRDMNEAVKWAACPVRNLSQSRNLGITLAAGEIVGYIDDDAIPEPEWLRDVAAAYDDPAVGAAGGFVYDHTGVDFQARFVTADRLGGVDMTWSRPAFEFNFPLSANFPHLLGTNCTFRRSTLISVGGFDEEYDYYLDETDLCCRVVDDGWKIAQIEGAYVHHKCLPSSLRDDRSVVRSWYSIVKNKIYYGLINRHGHHGVTDVMREANSLITTLSLNMEAAIREGKLGETDRARFWTEIGHAWETGLGRGMEGRRRLLSREARSGTPPEFRRFGAALPAGGRQTCCFISQDYPPGPVGGVGRYIHQLARGVAALGHIVYVITRGHQRDRVDFEDTVWVHRMVPRDPGPPPSTSAGMPIPLGIWSYSATTLNEIKRVAAGRPITGVYAPIWDCEGAAVLLDNSFPLITGLQTTLRFWLETNSHRTRDDTFMKDFVVPMLDLEALLLESSPILHAISAAILDEIEDAYRVSLWDRATVVPLGLEDYSILPAIPAPARLPGTTKRILFVGRLETRKGIDVLLAAAQQVLPRFPRSQLDVVGNDRLPGPDGPTYRAAFESDPCTVPIRDRVVFHGEVNDAALRGFYSACDVLVAPSRFESFGLIFVEGMMFGKPVIGCRAGGMVEVIADGETGLLAEPGDVTSLTVCMTRILEDEDLRLRLGAAGRRRYEACFTPERMARDVVTLFERARIARHQANAAA